MGQWVLSERDYYSLRQAIANGDKETQDRLDRHEELLNAIVTMLTPPCFKCGHAVGGHNFWCEDKGDDDADDHCGDDPSSARGDDRVDE